MNHPHPGLPYPTKLAKKTLRIVALGGLGEIGRNMTVFEYEGRLLIVDCGVLFPGEDQPGIDLILPDFSYIKDRNKETNMSKKEFFDALAFAACIALPFVVYFAFLMKP